MNIGTLAMRGLFVLALAFALCGALLGSMHAMQGAVVSYPHPIACDQWSSGPDCPSIVNRV
jgi:hypothetical protein